MAEDIQAFLADINQTDRKLQKEANEQEEKEKEIFEGGSRTKENKALNAQIEEI